MPVSTQLKQPFKDLIKKLFSRQISNFYIVFGRRGSGKTDFMLLLFEVLHDLEIIKHFATNTKIYTSQFHIERITNLEDLRFWSKENKGRKLFGLDEVGKTIGRRTPMKTLNVDMINELQVVRKHKLSLIATTIDEINTDRAILSPSVLDGVFIKPFFKNPKIAYFDDRLENRSATLKALPRTAIAFDTWDSAPFKRYGEKRAPKFKTKELELMWNYAHGASYKDLALHPQQLARLLRKFVKENMVRQYSQFTDK